MNISKNKKVCTLSFRIEENLNTKITLLSEKANRSKSNFVITLLTKAIDDIERNNNLMNQ